MRYIYSINIKNPKKVPFKDWSEPEYYGAESRANKRYKELLNHFGVKISQQKFKGIMFDPNNKGFSIWTTNGTYTVTFKRIELL